ALDLLARVRVAEHQLLQADEAIEVGRAVHAHLPLGHGLLEAADIVVHNLDDVLGAERAPQHVARPLSAHIAPARARAFLPVVAGTWRASRTARCATSRRRSERRARCTTGTRRPRVRWPRPS